MENPSPFISNLKVTNYRSIKALPGLTLKPLTFVIGKNNSGKSNIMKAIKVLMNTQKLSDSDFYADATESTVEIEIVATITGAEKLLETATPMNKTKITPYIANDTIMVRASAKKGDAKAKIDVWDSVGEVWHNPTGIDNAIRDILPTPIAIETFKDPSADFSSSRTSTIGKLLSAIAETMEDEREQLSSAISRISDLLNSGPDNEIRSGLLTSLEERLSDTLSQIYKDHAVRMRFDTPELSDLLAKVRLEAKEPDREWFECGNHGQGFQRMIVLSLVLVLDDVTQAAKSRGEQVKPNLILFEEPEAFLHPRLQSKLHKALERLSETSQIICTSHSPVFFDGFDRMAETVIVRKGAESIYYSCNQEISDSITDKQALTFFNYANTSHYLFSDSILLVEGISEEKLLGSTFPRCDEASQLEDVTIVSVGNKDSLQNWHRALTALGFNVKVLTDLDFCWHPAPKMLVGHATGEAAAARIVKALQDEGLWADGGVKKENKNDAFRVVREKVPGDLDIVRNIFLSDRACWILEDGEIEHCFGVTKKGDYLECAKKMDENGVVPPSIAAIATWIAS